MSQLNLAFSVAIILWLGNVPNYSLGQSNRGPVQLLLTPNSSIEVDIGTTVSYVCVSYGENQTANILWQFGDTNLMDDSLVKVYNTTVTVNNLVFTTSILQLCSIKLEDSGQYFCTASNSMGVDSFNFTLNVKFSNETLSKEIHSLSGEVQKAVNDSSDQTVENLTRIDTILSNVADIVSRPEVMSNAIDNNIIVDIVEVLNSLLQWKPTVFSTYNTSRYIEICTALRFPPYAIQGSYITYRIVESFERITSQYAQQILPNTNETFMMSLLTLTVENVVIEAVPQSGKNFVFYNDGTLRKDQVIADQLSPQQNAAIIIPASLFQTSNSTNVGAFFGIYERGTFFPAGGRNASNLTSGREIQLHSNVLAATVGQNTNFTQSVKVLFRLQNTTKHTLPGSEKCVSWDFNTQNWTTEGCDTHNGQNRVIRCQCNHLTNFAVLVTVCARQDCQPFCKEENITSTSGTKYVWLRTDAGKTAKFPCPNNVKVLVIRNCSIEGKWGKFDHKACGVVLKELNGLNDTFTNLTTENYGSAVSRLSRVIKMSENSTVEQNPSVLNTTAQYITELSVFVTSPMVEINETIAHDLVAVVNSLVQWNSSNIIAAKSSRIVESYERILSLYAQQQSLNESRSITLSSLRIVTQLESVETLAKIGRNVTIRDKHSIVNASKHDVTPGELYPGENASIILPPLLFESLTKNATKTGVLFGYYSRSTLFPIRKKEKTESKEHRGKQTVMVGTGIVAAKVGVNLQFQNLKKPVISTFRLQNKPQTGMFLASGSAVCVSWNFSVQNWTTQGCKTTFTRKDDHDIVKCSCNHLSNFCAIAVYCENLEDCLFNKGLTYISYIGIPISIVSLVLTIITLVVFKKLRQKDVSKFHIQLSLAIILMFIVALVLLILSAEDDTEPLYGGCVTISLLVHYFALTAIMWMGAEALLMFQKLVTVFFHITTKYIIIVSIICWTAPIIPVLVPFSVDMANGNDAEDDIVIRRGSGIGLSFCFLSKAGAFWGAFLGPVLAIMLFNLVIFFCIIVVIIRHAKRRATLKNETVDKKSILRMIISIGGIMFLFGLAWLFAIFMNIGPAHLREAFQVLFTIFNSFQGVFIFFFVCVLSSDARNEWKGIFKRKEIQRLYAQLSPSRSITDEAVEMSKMSKTNISRNSHAWQKM